MEIRTCNCETYKGENILSLNVNGDKLKGKNVNAHHKKTVNACDGYNSIYECGKNICHLMYKLAGTALDYLKEISITFIGEFTNYKFEFEGLQNRVADFE